MNAANPARGEAEYSRGQPGGHASRTADRSDAHLGHSSPPAALARPKAIRRAPQPAESAPTSPQPEHRISHPSAREAADGDGTSDLHHVSGLAMTDPVPPTDVPTSALSPAGSVGDTSSPDSAARSVPVASLRRGTSTSAPLDAASAGEPDEGASTSIAKATTIIVVACSAGSLTALDAFLRRLPHELPAAVVLLRHRTLDAPDALASLLAHRTEIQTSVIEDGAALRPGWVHLAPPHSFVTFEGPGFRVRDVDQSRETLVDSDPAIASLRSPVSAFDTPAELRAGFAASPPPAVDATSVHRFDGFIRSIVRGRRFRVIFVALDGAGADGLRGARQVVEAGGIVIAQDPETARFGDIARSLIAAHSVHLVLSPDRLAGEVARIVRRAHEFDLSRARSRRTTGRTGNANASDPTAGLRGLRRDVVRVLERHGDQKFDHLPPAFVDRRIERRVLTDGIERLSVWPQRLTESAEERRRLTSDLLVGVTWFFRDRLMWPRLARDVLTPQLQSLPIGGAYRAWVAGCGTGEEAYSLAILVRELLEELGRTDIDLRVFATDVDREGLQRTALGAWPEAAMVGISDERRRRFFRFERGHGRIDPVIRDSVVAARHDVVRDVPFTRMHLVMCRNLIRFFQPRIRTRVLHALAASVERGGALVVGQAECGLATAAGFALSDDHLPIIADLAARRSTTVGVTSRGRGARSSEAVSTPETQPQPMLLTPRIRRSRFVHDAAAPQESLGPDLQLLEVMHEDLCARSMGCFIVSRSLELRTAVGDLAGILQAPARPEVESIEDLLDASLARPLRSAVEEAFEHRRTTVREDVLTSSAHDARRVDLRVRPHFSSDHSDMWAAVYVESRLDLGLGSTPAIHSGAGTAPTGPSAPIGSEARSVRTSPTPSSATEPGRGGGRGRSMTPSEEGGDPLGDVAAAASSRHRPWIEANEVEHLRRHFERALQDQRVVSERERELNRELIAANESLSRANEGLHRRNSDLHSLMTAAELRVRELEGSLLEALQVLHCSQIGLVHLDASLRVVRFTPAASALINLTPEDVGRSISQVSHNLDDREISNRARRVVDEGEVAERLVCAPDGSTFRMRMHPYRRREATIEGVVITFVDVTEARETEEILLELNSALDALQTRNREMEEFVYTVSHDLKSPLVTIGGLVGLLREGLEGQPQAASPDVTGMFDLVEQTVETMRRLIDDLLEYSRIGRRFGRLEPVDLGAVAESVVMAHKAEIERAGMAVVVHDSLPTVIADRNRMEQVFDNLLVNALKYGRSGPDPTIQIGEASTEREWRIYVRDNGPGIAPRHHERIFGLFERLHTDRPGNGVGLTIVKRIMEALRGRIWVESAEGHGATFWLAFRRTLDPAGWPDAGLDAGDLSDPGARDEHARRVDRRGSPTEWTSPPPIP